MSESPDTPVAIDRVDRARGDGDRIRLRLSGRRLRTDHIDDEPLLVIQLQGRRHRFPADPAHGAPVGGGTWEATFTVPSWAEPRRAGQAAVWLGNTVVPMPLPGESTSAPPPALHPVSSWGRPAGRFPAPPALGQARAADCSSPEWPPAYPSAYVSTGVPAGRPAGAEEGGEPIVDTGRTGPLAELLFRENVTALHSELEQRSADVARLRGTLADAQAQLTARATTQAALEVAQAELRSELQQLMAAAGAQREDFDRRLAELESERDRLRSELASERDRLSAELDTERDRLTSERDRLAAELAQTRAEHASERARAGETAAELSTERDRLTEEVAALRAQLHEASSRGLGQDDDLSALREQLASTQVTRDAAASEAEGLRAELERLGIELAVSREQLAAQGGDLGEAQRLLADARAMTEQLRGQNPH